MNSTTPELREVIQTTLAACLSSVGPLERAWYGPTAVVVAGDDDVEPADERVDSSLHHRFVLNLIDEIVNLALNSDSGSMRIGLYHVLNSFIQLGPDERRYMIEDCDGITMLLSTFIEPRDPEGGPMEGYRITLSPIYGDYRSLLDCVSTLITSCVVPPVDAVEAALAKFDDDSIPPETSLDPGCILPVKAQELLLSMDFIQFLLKTLGQRNYIPAVKKLVTHLCWNNMMLTNIWSIGELYGLFSTL